MDVEENGQSESGVNGEPFITLGEAARLAGYTSTGTLRQAIRRERLRGEVRQHQLNFEYYVTKRSWLIEYLAQRPRFRDQRLERVLAQKG